jgi:hypothetical protein
MNIKEFPPITQMMDEGMKKDIALEAKVWNERLFKTEYKGTELDRFPLSPSQIGKCGLALARNLAHYLGVADYPRTEDFLESRVKRIFARGHLLESALISDLEKFTPLKIEGQQQRVKLFPVAKGVHIEGSIDGLAVHTEGDTTILVDFKSKGAFYSSGFKDSIDQFFQELRQTGLVEEIGETAFLIADVKALFDVISLDDFFVDYLLQLNSYAFAVHAEDVKKPLKVDFVSLYYENKNTCANYEIRWVPHKALFEYAQKKFKYIYETVTTEGPEAVPKEFSLGSARCRLCDHNELCWGKYEPKNNAEKGKIFVAMPPEIDKGFSDSVAAEYAKEKFEADAITFMSKQTPEATHFTTVAGVTYEKKFLKSPKPHYELRQVGK